MNYEELTTTVKTTVRVIVGCNVGLFNTFALDEEETDDLWAQLKSKLQQDVQRVSLTTVGELIDALAFQLKIEIPTDSPVWRVRRHLMIAAESLKAANTEASKLTGVERIAALDSIESVRTVLHRITGQRD